MHEYVNDSRIHSEVRNFLAQAILDSQQIPSTEEILRPNMDFLDDGPDGFKLS